MPSGAFFLILPSAVTTVPVAFSVGPQLTLNVANPSHVRLDKQRSQVPKPNSQALLPQWCSALPHLQPPALGPSAAAHHGHCWASTLWGVSGWDRDRQTEGPH